MAAKEDKEYPFERPPVTFNRAGVSSVSPADLIRSRVGQEQLQKVLNSSMYREIERERAAKKVDP
jgi:hypothetical protein